MKREPEIWSNRDVMTLTVMAPVCVRGLSALCDETGWVQIAGFKFCKVVELGPAP